MVDPWVLFNDVVATIGTWILTPVLWIGLFLWAWSRPAQARESGFGRMTFWLLLPGAFLSSLADAPFFPWAGNVLAINLGGALIPILVAVVLLRRELGTPGWTLTGMVLLFVALETAIQFVIVLVTASPWTEAFVAGTAALIAAFAILVFSSWMPRPSALRAATFVGLVSTAIPLTFLTSQAVPGQGIVSAFPFYLIGPVLVGMVGVWLAAAVWHAPVYRGLSAGYGGAILGTLIGADVLRQPPLYTGPGGSLLAIGGAGIEDLVYFSGLLAVGAGLFFIALSSWGAPSPAAVPARSEPGPDEVLRSAADRLAKGDPAGALRDSLTASQVAADRARSVWQIPAPTRPEAAWDQLPVAPYVVNDYRNLAATAGRPDPTPPEAFRSVAMATQFVRLGRDLTRLRFASPVRRAWATGVDLAVVTAPAAALWAVLAVTLPGSLDTILAGLPFNLAVFAYVAYAMLYFVAGDALFGATLGKRLLRLTVTDRNLARPTLLQSFLRESPKAVPLFVIGEFGAPALLYLLRAGSSPVSALGINLVLFTGAALLVLVIVAVGVAFSIGAIQVARDSERQRLGDRWASTWVVDRRMLTPAWGAQWGPSTPPPAPAPPG